MLAKYKIDPAHSSAQFGVRPMMISNVRGGNGSVQGTVAYDSQNVATSKVDVQIDATTINTMENARTPISRAPTFFMWRNTQPSRSGTQRSHQTATRTVSK